MGALLDRLYKELNLHPVTLDEFKGKMREWEGSLWEAFFPSSVFLTDQVPLEEQAALYDGYSWASVEAVAPLVVAQLTEQGTVLDVGPGTGTKTFYYARSCPKSRIIAVEKDIAAVRLIEERKKRLGIQNVEVVHGDIREVKLSDQFTTVIMVDVFHPYSDLEEQVAVNQAARSFLAPGEGHRFMFVEYPSESLEWEALRLEAAQRAPVESARGNFRKKDSLDFSYHHPVGYSIQGTLKVYTQ
ncbi:MAG TPA: methyltransferase domain-containing protein [Candidatus Nanoarchaeia archaeon]|nr:methyltransferase domain-containing protein [Candidatus Nanoarchaeia archaeon]